MPRSTFISENPNLSHQTLESIEIKNLKCLRDVTIDFSEKQMVAIMAPNGYGKSSILHALFCSYNLPNQRTNVNYFNKFFRPTNLSTWNNTEFTIKYNYQLRGNNANPQPKTFKKTPQRWCRYEERPLRYVEYIGINTCVPSIELYPSWKGEVFTKTVLDTDVDNKVKDCASRVMQRIYREYSSQKSRKKTLIGVKDSLVEYTSLSMGAGEQRIFYILKKLYSAPRYSLILIDEIDLLLHEDALSRLLDEINEICNSKKLQLIFTTHARSILSKDYLAFQHLFQTNNTTYCFDRCYPELLSRLTGNSTRECDIFVEDDVAKAIVEQLCLDEGIRKYITIHRVGTGDIVIKSACGMIVNGNINRDRTLFLTDGDKLFYDDIHTTETVKAFFHGDDPAIIEKREEALRIISKFVMKDCVISPEEYYRESILSLNVEDLSVEEKLIFNELNQVVVPENKHDYFNLVIDRIGLTKEVGLSKIVALLSKTENWNKIVERLSNWIAVVKPNLVIPIN